MTVEPGWYYAEGDPAGTLRRWNGEAWVGFPIAQPGATQAQAAQQAAAVAAAPTQGLASLKAPAILAQIGLLILFIAHIALGWSYLRLSTSGEGAGLISEGLEDQFSLTYLIWVIGSLLAAVTFVVWFATAYRNIGLWALRRRGMIWTVLAWIIPFINLVRPMSMMLELVEHSPRADRQGELSPTPVIAWWFLWLLPGIAGAVLTINSASRDIREIAKNVFAIQGVVTLLNAVSVLLAIYLVQVITDSQERRKAY